MDETADLLRANAGRILGEMLGGGITGTEREGDHIGPYRLCELIGEGGFGNVWRAEQTEVVKREVALKVIKLGMDTAQVLGRFNQERQALASLDHPNITTMLDAGVSPDGRPYFSMELVRGGPVTGWCDSHELPVRERLRLFVQVCRAVQHAHDKGILHRDLKPTNVLVSEVDGQPVPKVIDFGIAKALHAAVPGELSILTQADQVIGTPVYMSPEQIEGGKELDARSDVYALGVLLYELLTGAQPFKPTALGASGIEAVKRMIVETIPERPSTRVRGQPGRQVKRKTGLPSPPSALPADLDWITMRALEKDRARRYQTAGEFAADVQRHIDSQPVVARPPSLAYAAGRWGRRHGPLMTVCMAVLSSVALWHHFSSPLPGSAGQGPKALPRLPPPKPLSAADVAKRSVTNSLGMKFMPVPVTGVPADKQEVLFSIWETRVQDYQAFVDNTGREWAKPDFEQGPTHPAVNVTWDDANAFCAWLTKHERQAGKPGSQGNYRLPTDHEWSCAAGLGEQEEATKPPEQKSKAIPNLYPWGTQWPPPAEAGNYLSNELRSAFANGGFQAKGEGHGTRLANIVNPVHVRWLDRLDGYAATAPAGNYAANRFGLYDLGGNVWEWCADPYREKDKRVWRGGSFLDSFPAYMLSSRREGYPTTYCRVDCGFRVVMEATPATAPPQASKAK